MILLSTRRIGEFERSIKLSNEVRKQKRSERNHILELMKECLIELLEEGQLTGQAKLAAVKMLDQVRTELHLDHDFY